MSRNKSSYETALASSKKDGSSGSIVEMLLNYFKHWRWFLLSIVVLLATALVYIRYTEPVYNVASTVLLKHEKDGANTWAGSLGSLGLSGMKGVSSMDNEIYLMQSITMVRSVMDRLNLHTSYKVKKGLKLKEIYNETPLVVSMEKAGLDSLKRSVQFTAQLHEGNSILVRGEIGGKEYDTVLSDLPALLDTPQGAIIFSLNKEVEPFYQPLQITIAPPRFAVHSYRSALVVEKVDRFSAVLKLALKTTNVSKGIDFLDALIDVYNHRAVEDKNQEAINTRNFIIDRLDIIDKELNIVEGEVESYKLEKRMTDLDADLLQSLQQSSRYEQQLVKAETQLNIVSSLGEWVSKPYNRDKAVPSNIGLQDPTLSATVNEYNQLLAERERLARSIEDGNPVMERLNEQVEALRVAIISSIESVVESLSIERRNIANQVRIYGGKIDDLPKREREYIDIARNQKVMAELYSLLLQKREENALALAATRDNASILDGASWAGLAHPRKKIVLIGALLLGLLLPIGIIYLLDIVQYKIRNRGDVDKLTKLPVLGEIPTHKDAEKVGNIAVSENGATEQDEAFRILRTNLLFSIDAKDKVVVFTSTVAGEGKSFAAINTAISLALLNKKVLLLGMDLRIPRLHNYLHLPNDKGISSFLSGYEADMEQLIFKTNISKHLFVMPAGPIPPNPAELLSRSTLDEAMEQLRKMFDYIIIDSAPTGLVTDTLIINRIADANVYMCRANFSSKMNLKFANDLLANSKLSNMLLVINDVKDFNRGYGSGYGYSQKKE